MTTREAPIELDFEPNNGGKTSSIRTFTSYTFDRNVLIPAAAFRFTAPGVDKSARLAIRSGCLVTLWTLSASGEKRQVGTGIIDETDTHISPSSIEYVLSGRDMLGQLVDNTAIDNANKPIYFKSTSVKGLGEALIKNTRIPPGIIIQGASTGDLEIITNFGETKINVFQRYAEFANCLLWSAPNGQVILGQPDFTQDASGTLRMSLSSPKNNNLLECRVRRNLNQAIRQMVAQLSTRQDPDPGKYTKRNNDPDMKAVFSSKVGRSVYDKWDYGQGTEAFNKVTTTGNQSGNPNSIGETYAIRAIARDNAKLLEVEAVVEGHLNSSGLPYDVDQIYRVQIEDEDVAEDLYVFACTYELTVEHGMLTRLKLCRKGTLVIADALPRSP